jgi:hypothetical protein
MIKNSLKHLLFICLLSTQVFAQKEGTQSGDPNDLDFKFIPDKNSILNSAKDSKTSSDKYSERNVKNIIKYNFALLGRSTVAFAWEHAFGDLMSVEAGLGVCVGQDYMQKTFAPVVADVFYSNSNSVKLSDLLSNSVYSSPSLFLSAGTKLYFTNDAPYGSYVHFNIRYSTNNLTYMPNNNNLNNNILLVGSPDVTIKNLGFNVIYGFQIISGNSKASVTHDFYAGFGIRRSTYNDFIMTSTTNSNGNYQEEYINSGNTRSIIEPVVLIGYCLGLGF